MKNLNTSGYPKLENIWKRDFSAGSQVGVKIQPSYVGDSVRPDKFKVVYQVNDNNPIQIFLKDQAGQ
ncbi:DNA/RNA non-specific endonuclease [Spongorhabdus nitratireducens]